LSNNEVLDHKYDLCNHSVHNNSNSKDSCHGPWKEAILDFVIWIEEDKQKISKNNIFLAEQTSKNSPILYNVVSSQRLLLLLYLANISNALLSS
jgi:hypothetical protein